MKYWVAIEKKDQRVKGDKGDKGDITAGDGFGGIYGFDYFPKKRKKEEDLVMITTWTGFATWAELIPRDNFHGNPQGS